MHLIRSFSALQQRLTSNQPALSCFHHPPLLLLDSIGCHLDLHRLSSGGHSHPTASATRLCQCSPSSSARRIPSRKQWVHLNIEVTDHWKGYLSYTIANTYSSTSCPSCSSSSSHLQPQAHLSILHSKLAQASLSSFVSFAQHCPRCPYCWPYALQRRKQIQ